LRGISLLNGQFICPPLTYGSDAIRKVSPLFQVCLAIGLSLVFTNGKSAGTAGKRLMGKLSLYAIRRILKGLLAILVSSRLCGSNATRLA
ncbi:MAG: hypothetical protein KGL39_40215, partial [Patescibacteria group bacterium]|nr:hypothetical protein [Patescibacteria group bacterium]